MAVSSEIHINTEIRLGQLSGVIGLRIEPSEWLLCLGYEHSCSVN